MLYSLIYVIFILIILLYASVYFAYVEEGYWSGLKIIDYILLEDVSGNRYARITYTNPTENNKIFEARYFIAILMNPDATKVEGSSTRSSYFVSPKEIRTETIYFGRHYFPIAYIETK